MPRGIAAGRDFTKILPENTDLDLVWRLYSFDCRMRLVIADALAAMGFPSDWEKLALWK